MTQWIFKFNPTEFGVYVTKGTAGPPNLLSHQLSCPNANPSSHCEHRILPGFLISQSAFCLAISFTLYIWEHFLWKWLHNKSLGLPGPTFQLFCIHSSLPLECKGEAENIIPCINYASLFICKTFLLISGFLYSEHPTLNKRQQLSFRHLVYLL